MPHIAKIRPGCDIRTLPLTPADAFLLSRVDGTANEHDLALVTGFAVEQVIAMLERLAALGAIELAGGGVSQIRPRATQDPGAARAPLAARPAPERSISPLPGEPEDAGALRRKVFARKLSSTRVLATAAAPAPDTAHAERTAEAVHAHYEEAATGARAALIAQNLEQGKSALARKDFSGAINAYRMAASLAPDDPELQATCNDGIRVAAAAVADDHWDQAVLEESQERWEEASLAYAKVCTGRPSDGQAHERVANAALRSSNVRRAVEFARKAVEIAPTSAMFHITLGRAYAAAGFATSARNELDRALDLAPKDARILHLVARLRSPSGKMVKVG
jgi:Flp pilus assembly protein TadD